MNPVSVIIPAYNAAPYLAAAIESALRQTCAPAEIIVVDDGSTDETGQVAQRFGERVRYVRQENAGPAAARNHGARLARGEWLAFLDGDDEWLPWRLQTQLTQAQRRPDVVLWCGQTTGLTGEVQCPMSPPTRRLALADFAVNNPVATTTVLLRRTAFEAAGGFDERFRGPEDYDLWMRVAAVGRVGALACPLARYRTTAGSLSMDERRFLPQVLAVLEKAYGAGGVLRDLLTRDEAFAYQYASASWMAYRRGARARALGLLLRSVARRPRALRSAPERGMPWQRLKLLYRYCTRSPAVSL